MRYADDTEVSQGYNIETFRRYVRTHFLVVLYSLRREDLCRSGRILGLLAAIRAVLLQ